MASKVEINLEEKFEFKSSIKRNLFIGLAAGILLFVVGLITDNTGHAHSEHHAEVETVEHVEHTAVEEGHSDATEHGEDHGGHHTIGLKHRIVANLWVNNVIFTGLALIGIFFVAVQYVAYAGWSAQILRVPLAMGAWLPFAGLFMIITFFAGSHEIFHWTHEYLYDVNSPEYDSIIAGKEGYLNTPFFVGRMIVYFLLWIGAYLMFNKFAKQEDLNGGVGYWHKMTIWGAGFLVIFGVTTSTSAWDWAMSIDTHWFSTIFGWYTFAGWWVSGLTVITLILVFLKDSGYFKGLNDSHFHDMGKFMFAFSIFWTYTWFAQFLLIYYANIPEETTYFMDRMYNFGGFYLPIFILVILLNFIFPILWLMTRESKRKGPFLKIAGAVVLLGHYLDFYNMMMPGIMKGNGGVGFMEIGTVLIYGSLFLLVVFTALSELNLLPKNHPMLQESIHHHI